MHSPSRPRRRGVSGVTLIELLVTLAVLAILATMAAPALSEIMWSLRLSAQADKIVTSLNHARSEAIYRRKAVVVKGYRLQGYDSPCNTGASGGFDWTNSVAFVDRYKHRHDAMPNPGFTAGSGLGLLLGTNSVQRNGFYGQDASAPPLFSLYASACAIVFHDDGLPRAITTSAGEKTQTFEIIVCRPGASSGQNARRIVMMPGGRIRVVAVNGEGRCPPLTS